MGQDEGDSPSAILRKAGLICPHRKRLFTKALTRIISPEAKRLAHIFQVFSPSMQNISPFFKEVAKETLVCSNSSQPAFGLQEPVYRIGLHYSRFLNGKPAKARGVPTPRGREAPSMLHIHLRLHSFHFFLYLSLLLTYKQNSYEQTKSPRTDRARLWRHGFCPLRMG
jgi:hypothetical protein